MNKSEGDFVIFGAVSSKRNQILHAKHSDEGSKIGKFDEI